MAIRLWASRLASLTAFYISEVLAVHAAQADANRALREMSPPVATRPDEIVTPDAHLDDREVDGPEGGA